MDAGRIYKLHARSGLIQETVNVHRLRPSSASGSWVLRSEILGAGERALGFSRDRGGPSIPASLRNALALDFKADGFEIVNSADYAPFIHKGKAAEDPPLVWRAC